MLTLQNPEPCLDARYSQHVVVPFNAWSTPSFNDFAADLTDAIRSAIAVHLADHRLGSGWFRARSAWVGHKLRMPNRHRRWEPPPDRELSIALDRLWRQGRSAVVFVDDIDRCDPRTVGVVLETVRTLVHQFPDGRVRFVLAFDADLLASYLDASTADTDAGRSGERGRAMLEKLISVQLRLPVRLRRLPGEDVPPAKG
jgi:predicted KAP-like P-loop ATPase